jgi:hypothetical protein
MRKDLTVYTHEDWDEILQNFAWHIGCVSYKLTALEIAQFIAIGRSIQRKAKSRTVVTNGD